MNSSSTGDDFISFFPVRGDLKSIRENDVFKVGVGTEQIKVLNVDELSKRIRVLEDIIIQLELYTASVVLEELPRSFSFDIGVSTTYSARRNREHYFNPAEAGNIQFDVAAVGVGTIRQIQIPVPVRHKYSPSGQYLPDHGLETGDIVTYQLNATNETAINVNSQRATPENDETLFQNAPLFVGKISNDLLDCPLSKLVSVALVVL